MAALDFSDVQVGQIVPAYIRTTSLMEWNRFAAVNDEFVSFHMDDDAGRAVGNARGAFGMGNLRLSYILNMVRDWCGDDVEIRSLSLRYRRLNQRGDELRCIGEIVGVEIVDGEQRAHLRVDVLDYAGESTAPGSVTVVFPRQEVHGG